MKRLGRSKGRFAASAALACAVSLTGLILMSGGQSAAANLGSAGAIKVVDVAGIGLSGISCNSKTFCVAVGSQSNEAAVLPISHGVPESPEIVPGVGSQSYLWAVDCPDSAYCAAIGQGPQKSPEGPTTTAGLVVGITNGMPNEASWILGPGPIGAPDHDYLYGVGCSSASECLATGDDGYLAGVVVPLKTGKFRTIGDDDMYGVSCFEKNYCIATGSNAPQGNSTNSGLAIMEKVNQNAIVDEWDGGSSLYGTACHEDNTDSCVAVGISTNGKKGIIVPIVKLKSHTAVDVSGTTALNGIACEGSSYCVAVGQSSSGEGVLVGITGSKLGERIPVPGTTQLLAVGCASNMSCMAVGSDSSAAVLVEFSLPVR
jgi:hypothetical protein